MPMAATETPQDVDAWLAQAHACRHANVRRSHALVRRAYDAARRIDYQRGVAYGLLRLALCEHMLREDPDRVEQRLQQATALMRALGDLAGEAEALNLQASVLSNQARHDAALQRFQAALELRCTLDDREGQAITLNNIGLTLRRQGRLTEALESLLTGLALAQSIDAAIPCAYAEVNIAAVLADLGDMQGAVEHYRRCLDHVGPTEDRALECTALTGLAEALAAAGQRREAVACLQAAHALAEQTGNVGDRTRLQLAWGRVLLEMDDVDAAARWLQSALEALRRDGDLEIEPDTMRLVAHAQLRSGDAAAASATADAALARAREQSDPTVVASCHRLLAEAEEARGNLAQALAHFRAFHDVQQRTTGQAALRRAQTLIGRHEIDRVQREAASQRDLNQALGRELDAARAVERHQADLLAELAAQTEMLQQMAREDGLTGVANRRWLDAQFARERERARRFGHPLSVAMIDIDDFKAINDRLSHAVGDAVLRTVARVLRDNCRVSDLVARYGGEEFTIVMIETGPDSAVGLADKLRRRVQAFPWPTVHAELSAVTVSVGVAGTALDDLRRDLLAEADAALYRAKRGGKNRVVDGS